jgi:hypothetical protein
VGAFSRGGVFTRLFLLKCIHHVLTPQCMLVVHSRCAASLVLCIACVVIACVLCAYMVVLLLSVHGSGVQVVTCGTSQPAAMLSVLHCTVGFVVHVCCCVGWMGHPGGVWGLHATNNLVNA